MSSTSCFTIPSQRPSRGTPPWAGLSVLLLAGFVTIFDLFVVNVAIPSIQTRLGANFAQIGLIVAGYELAFGVMLITGGRLGDMFGRRRLFITGMAGFTLASAFCGLAPGTGYLICARVLQGLAAALLFPQVYASILVNFEDNDRRKAFGLLGMTLGLAAIAGQVLGGWLVHADLFGLSWRSIFLINLPIGALAILAARSIPESRAPQRPLLDWPGVLLVSCGLVLILAPLIEGPVQGWPDWSRWAPGIGLAILILFYRQQEKRRIAGKWPLVDMSLMANSHFSLGTMLVLLVYSTSSSFFLCFALLIQTGLGLDAFHAGSIFAPCSVGFMLASLAAPRLVARWGTYSLFIGALTYAVFIAIMIFQVWMSGSELKPVQLIPALIMVGAGQGYIMTPLLNLVLSFVEEAESGMASGVISTVQQIGAALGVGVVGILFNGALSKTTHLPHAGQYASAFVAGMLYNLAASAVICLSLLMLKKTQPTES
ncbi:Multidrug resistance protein stp [compost metagenome]